MNKWILILLLPLLGGCSALRAVNAWPQRNIDANEGIKAERGVARVDYVVYARYPAAGATPAVLSGETGRPYEEIGSFTARDGGDFAESFADLLDHARERARLNGADAVTNVQTRTVSVGASADEYSYGRYGAGYESRERLRKELTGVAIRYK